MTNPQTTLATDPEYTTLLLGHRTMTSTSPDGDYERVVHHYSTHPVPLARPHKRRAKGSVQCESCGKTVRVKLWAEAETRRAVRRRWWSGFGLATAAGWSFVGVAASLSGRHDLLHGLAWTFAVLWFPALMATAPILANSEPVEDDCWVKVVRGRGHHRMLRPGQTTVEHISSRRIPDL